MKIDKINDNTIICTLNTTDKDSIIITKSQYNQIFYKALILAKRRYNFTTTNQKLLIKILDDNLEILTFSISILPNESLENKEFFLHDSDDITNTTVHKLDSYDTFCDFINCISKESFDSYFTLCHLEHSYYIVPSVEICNIPSTIITQLLDFTTPIVDIYLYNNLIKHSLF